MCGLGGEIRFDGRSADVGACGRVTVLMADRGPDGYGIWARGPVALGHRRLSIIDLSAAGSQPMVDSALGLTVVFNGCIYNYQELRAELEGHGYRFFSTSDTEVIGKAYAQWGTACVDHFLGMFAFAVVEHASGRLVLARDRLGIKPLYLDQTADRLRFASTLPALLAGGGTDTSIDPVALAHYMTFHSVVPRAADHPERASGSCRRRPSGWSSPTGPATERTLLGARTSAATPSGPTGPTGTGRRRCWSSLRIAVDRRMVADVRSGCCCPAASTPRWSSRCWPRPGSSDLQDLQHRLRVRRRRVRRRVRVLHAGRQAVRHRPPPDHDRQLAAAARHRRRHRRDERADGQPRLRRLLPAQRGRRQQRQGGPVRPGRRRGARRLRLVPAAGRRARADAGGGGVRGRVLRPALVGHELAWSTRTGCSTTTPRATFIADRFGRPGRRDRRRRRAAQRHHGDAGRRPGQAGGQHDDGLGPGGAGAVPRPRAGRAGRPHPAGAQAGRRRQGRAQAGAPRRRARRGDRPDQGLLPGAGDPPARRARSWTGCATR